jgi:hypothetical protein
LNAVHPWLKAQEQALIIFGFDDKSLGFTIFGDAFEYIVVLCHFFNVEILGIALRTNDGGFLEFVSP